MLIGQKNFTNLWTQPHCKKSGSKTIQAALGTGYYCHLCPLQRGIIDLGIYEGNVGAAMFPNFARDKLCPNLLPFNGINPHSMVVLSKESL